MNTLKPPDYWNDFANVERELRAFIAKHGESGIMPTAAELNQAGYVALANAIYRHQGYKVVAKRLGLQWQRTKQPDKAYLERDLRAFIAQHGQPGTMPTKKQLQAAYRSDLAVRIEKYGGFKAIARRIGLKRQSPVRRKG